MFNFTFPWEGGNLSRRKEANSYLWHIFLLTVSQDSNKASSLLPALSSILFRTSVCYLTSSFWSNVTGPAFSSKQSVWIRTLYFHNSEVKNAMAIDLQWSLPSFFSLGSWRHADFTCHFFLISQLWEENSRMLLTDLLKLQVTIGNMEKELFFLPSSLFLKPSIQKSTYVSEKMVYYIK